MHVACVGSTVPVAEQHIILTHPHVLPEARLEHVFVRCFANKARPAGWFRHKLVRECVEGCVSVTAAPGSQRDDLIGFVLAGRPPSCAPFVRTAGTGVLPSWRGRGVARALLDALVCNARTHQAGGIWLLAERELEAFYLHHGFHARTRRTHWLRPATATFAPPRPYDEPSPGWHDAAYGCELAAWLQEAWQHTAYPRFVRTANGLRALVAHEPTAMVVHRLNASHSAPTQTAAQHLFATLPNAPAVLVAGVPDHGPLPPILHALGLRPVQRLTDMHHDLR